MGEVGVDLLLSVFTWVLGWVVTAWADVGRGVDGEVLSYSLSSLEIDGHVV